MSLALPASTAPAPVRNVRHGILLMVVGLALFSVLNGVVKSLMVDFPVNQVVFLRNALALVTLLLMARNFGGLQALRVNRAGPLALQGLLFTGVLVFVYVAYGHMPLADATAISFLQPLLVVMLSSRLLGEKVSKTGWIAVALGLSGVLLMIRPTGNSSAFGVTMSLIGTAFSAVYLLQQRNLSREESTLAITFWTLAGCALLTLPTLPFFWVQPTGEQWAWLIGNGLASGFCQYLTTRALFHAPAATVAPLKYTMIVWAVVIGYLWFGDVPSLGMLAGSAIVIWASWLVYREEPAADSSQADPAKAT